MKYTIIQSKFEIKVYNELDLVFIVKTNLDWFSIFRLSFYYKNELFLKSTCSFFIFKKYLKIKFNKFDKHIFLLKKHGKTYLSDGKNLYGLIWAHFKNLENTITKNDKAVAKLITNKTLSNWYFGNPSSRTFSFEIFENELKDSKIILLRLLLEFPPLNF